MVWSLGDSGIDRSLGNLIDESKEILRHTNEKSMRERIHTEVNEKKYYKGEEDLEEEGTEKRIPLSYLLQHGDKITLEYALEYYKDEFKKLRFDPKGEILDLEMRLRNRFEAWFLLVPLDIYKDVLMAIPRRKIPYITGKDIIPYYTKKKITGKDIIEVVKK